MELIQALSVALPYLKGCKVAVMGQSGYPTLIYPTCPTYPDLPYLPCLDAALTRLKNGYFYPCFTDFAPFCK